MIEVKNLNKYFNKNKQNEIHVINDTNIRFPKTGLVCLLGPSGCGKTTLLNVIGGLDKVDSGEIVINDVKINKYNSKRWDYIRNLHFGYIFQSYILLPDLSVYQNLKFVLKMLNLREEEIDERIDYALNAVGMIKYKKRKARQLSGGQQQRIVIARALIKSPNIIIADEPTGNLDEKNTTQIMNIIKKLSKECLVILVTHEKRLANFYADEIIEIKDGQVMKRFDVTDKDDLHNLDDSNIYLKEFSKKVIEDQDLNIEYFFKEDKLDIKLKVVINNNTVYIQSNQDNLNIKLIDKSSEIKLCDSVKPVLKQENIDDFKYKLPRTLNDNKHYKPALNLKDAFKMSISNIQALKIRQKALFIVFFLTAIMVVLGLANYISATYVNEKEFLYDNRNIVNIENFDSNNVSELKEELEVDIILAPYNELRLSRFFFDLYLQSQGGLPLPNNTLLPIEVLDDPVLIMGKLPTTYGEIVVDKWLIDIMIEDMNYNAFGISDYDQYLGLIYNDNNLDIEGKIVGIVDTNNPNVYCTLKEYQLAYINNTVRTENFILYENTKIDYYYKYEDYKQNTNTKKTYSLDSLNLENNEILVSKDYFGIIVDNIRFGNKDYKVVGVYDAYGNEDIIIRTNSLEDLMLDYLTLNQGASVYTTDKVHTIKKLLQLGYYSSNVYQAEYNKNQIININNELYFIAISILIASFIFLYFIIRSSLASRIYEIGVYRALGVKKSNIYKIFSIEIIIITLISSGFGVLFITSVINEVNSFVNIVHYPWYVTIFSIGFLLICNVLVGMIPIFNLLRLTPSQILTKYDI